MQASLLFASKLTEACAELTAVPREARAAALRALLSQLSAEGVAEGCWLPTASRELRNHAVQSLLPQEAVPISTNRRPRVQ